MTNIDRHRKRILLRAQRQRVGRSRSDRIAPLPRDLNPCDHGNALGEDELYCELGVDGLFSDDSDTAALAPPGGWAGAARTTPACSPDHSTPCRFHPATHDPGVLADLPAAGEPEVFEQLDRRAE